MKIILFPLKLFTVQVCFYICQLIHLPSFRATSNPCSTLRIWGLPEKVQFYRWSFVALFHVKYPCLVFAPSSMFASKRTFLGYTFTMFLYLYYLFEASIPGFHHVGIETEFFSTEQAVICHKQNGNHYCYKERELFFMKDCQIECFTGYPEECTKHH